MMPNSLLESLQGLTLSHDLQIAESNTRRETPHNAFSSYQLKDRPSTFSCDRQDDLEDVLQTPKGVWWNDTAPGNSFSWGSGERLSSDKVNNHGRRGAVPFVNTDQLQAREQSWRKNIASSQQLSHDDWKGTSMSKFAWDEHRHGTHGPSVGSRSSHFQETSVSRFACNDHGVHSVFADQARDQSWSKFVASKPGENCRSKAPSSPCQAGASGSETELYSWNAFQPRSSSLKNAVFNSGSESSSSSTESSPSSVQCPFSLSLFSSGRSSPEQASNFDQRRWGCSAAAREDFSTGSLQQQHSSKRCPPEQWGQDLSQKNLETNIRWLANSQLYPTAPTKLSTPHNCHRRSQASRNGRPILGTATMKGLHPSGVCVARPPIQPSLGGGSIKDPIVCQFCRKNGETREFYTTHKLKDTWGRVICPVLRAYTCPNCGMNGDNAHTLSYCPYR